MRLSPPGKQVVFICFQHPSVKLDNFSDAGRGNAFKVKRLPLLLAQEPSARENQSPFFQSPKSLCLVSFSFFFLKINGQLYCKSEFCCSVKKTRFFSLRFLLDFLSSLCSFSLLLSIACLSSHPSLAQNLLHTSQKLVTIFLGQVFFFRGLVV